MIPAFVICLCDSQKETPLIAFLLPRLRESKIRQLISRLIRLLPPVSVCKKVYLSWIITNYKNKK